MSGSVEKLSQVVESLALRVDEIASRSSDAGPIRSVVSQLMNDQHASLVGILHPFEKRLMCLEVWVENWNEKVVAKAEDEKNKKDEKDEEDSSDPAVNKGDSMEISLSGALSVASPASSGSCGGAAFGGGAPGVEGGSRGTSSNAALALALDYGMHKHWK